MNEINDEKCDNNPWDPVCKCVPKPEFYTVFCPLYAEAGNDCKSFLTFEEAKDYIDEYTDGVGVIHKHATQIVYFNKEQDSW